MHVQKRDKGIGTKSGLAAETGNNERGDQGETKCGGLCARWIGYLPLCGDRYIHRAPFCVYKCANNVN